MKTIMIEGRTVCIHGDLSCGTWVLQLTGSHEADRLQAELAAIDAAAAVPYCLIAITVSDWNRDLSPWPAPPAFGSEPFGGEAQATLTYVTEQLLPALSTMAGTAPARVCIAGYSLAGLFALWAATQTDAFSGVAAASPSVWYPDWLQYSEEHPIQAKRVYLSLGDREAKTRHPLMRTVADCIQAQHAQLTARGVDTTLVWNPGNHFVDADRRLAGAIAWVLKNDF